MKKQIFCFAIVALALAILTQSCGSEPTNKPEPAADANAQVDSFYCLFKGITNQDGGYVFMVDKVDFLTGEAAVAAARKAGEAEMEISEKGDTTWMVMNDYYISNPDMASVTMPIAPDAAINLLNPETGQPGLKVPVVDFAKSTELHNFPYQMRVKDGKIVGIRMQWVP